MLRITLSWLRWAALATLMVNVATAQIPPLDPIQVIRDPFTTEFPFEEVSGYGCSVAIDGNTAVVYACHLSRAYVYRRDASGEPWTEVQRIEFDVPPSDYPSRYIVAMRDDTLLVAAGGPVLVYIDDGDGFAFQTSFSPTGTVLDDRVFFDGDTALVSGDGSAFVFERTGDTWTEAAKLRPSDATAVEASALHRNTLLLSALDRTGVDVFVRRGGEWVEQQRLEPIGAVSPPSGANVGFGASAAVYNNVAVIGAPTDFEIVPPLPEHGDPPGAAFVFVRHGNTWTQQQKLLTSTDPAEYIRFGDTVAVEQGIIVVGTPDPCGRDCERAGSIYGFVREGTDWVEVFVARGPHLFGTSISLRKGQLLVGGPGLAFRSSGEVRFYDVRPLPKDIPQPGTQASTAR